MDNWLSQRVPILNMNMGSKGKDFKKASAEYAKQIFNVADTQGKYGTKSEVNYGITSGIDAAGKYDPSRRMVMYQKDK